MSRIKPDPKNPAFRKQIYYQVVGTLFIVPSLSGLWFLLPPLHLLESLVCSILLAVGMTAFALAKQAEYEWKQARLSKNNEVL